MNHKPQEFMVNGVRMLAGRPRDFECLLALHRQLGSQGPRLERGVRGAPDSPATTDDPDMFSVR